MFEQEKIPYEPSLSKRFQISEDVFSKERLYSLLKYREVIQKILPNVSNGLVLFGSLSKGKKLEKEIACNTDIDFTLYIDLDEYLEKYFENISNNEILSDFEFRRLISKNNNLQDKKLIENFFQSVKDKKDPSDESLKLIQKINIDNSDEIFLYYLALWYGYITEIEDENSKELLKFFGKKEYPIERMAELLKVKDVQVLPIQIEEKFSIFNQVNHLLDCEESSLQSSNERFAYIADQEQIGIMRLFGLDVGGGMKKYRQDFIRKLRQLPKEKGEKYWKVVDRAVRRAERGDNIPNEIERQFPATLEEAIKYYGV